MTHLDDLLYASLEDQKFFIETIKGLPLINGFSGNGLDSNGQPMPFCLGAHSVRCLREIIEITKPKNIIEIGLNVGVSSALWLEMSEANVMSCDISDRKETITAGEMLHDRYGSRFKFVICDSAYLVRDWIHEIAPMKPDLIFIDGAHDESSVVKDIGVALSLGIKHVVFDDFLEQFGEVQQAIAHFHQLKQVKVLGNIALYENTSI